jgi:glycosidase
MSNRFLTAALLLTVACPAPKAPEQSQSSTPTMPTGDTTWVRQSALYEVFVQDFSPSGDFKGVTANLDRIETAGANVIWLMPIHPIGEKNRKGVLGSPYAPRDYRGINPALGTSADLKELIAAAHTRGMKVILDWVPDHTSPDHAWVKDHPDYYHRNEKGEPLTPRDGDGKLTDWTDVSQLDFGNPAVRKEMTDVMSWWLKEYDLDGYRVDVAGFVPDDYWKEAVPAIRASVPKRILLLAEWGDLKMHTFGFDLTYGWDAYKNLKEVWKGASADSFIQREVTEVVAMPANTVGRLRFTTNHDETAWDDTPVAIFGAGARAAFVANILLPGRPLLYNGQEVESPQKLPLFSKELVNWDHAGGAEARAFYARVLKLARTDSAFTGGALAAVKTSDPRHVIAYARGNRLVLVNPRNKAVSFSVENHTVDGAEDLLGSPAQKSDKVNLPPYGAVVLAPVK